MPWIQIPHVLRPKSTCCMLRATLEKSVLSLQLNKKPQPKQISYIHLRDKEISTRKMDGEKELKMLVEENDRLRLREKILDESIASLQTKYLELITRRYCDNDEECNEEEEKTQVQASRSMSLPDLVSKSKRFMRNPSCAL